MFDLAFRFVARRIGVPVLQVLRCPPAARLCQGLSRLFGANPRPPHAAVETSREWAELPTKDGRRYTPVLASLPLTRRVPLSIYERTDWRFTQWLKFQTPPVFLVTVPQGRVLGKYGAVVSGDGVVLGDISFEWFFKPSQHSLLFKVRLPPARDLPGTTINLATASGWNYYHWLFDVLPRLAILEQAGVDWRTANWFVTNEGNAPFQRETLATLGIPAERVVTAGAKSHYACERLLAPSFPSLPSQTPPWVVAFLREKFLPATPVAKTGRRIYLSRQRSRYRRLTNETEVRALLLRHGFEEVFPEDLSFRGQIELFAGAAAIVAPHGAGLANLVFCPPQTTVVEIFPPTYVNPCFWILADQVEARYHYVLGTGPTPPEGHDHHRVEDDITVPIADLEKTLRLAGLI